MSRYYLLFSILVSLNGRSQPQTTIIRDVMPESYVIYQSNQYDSNFQCLQDDQCARVASPSQEDDRKRSSGEQRLLLCLGSNTTLFDGVIGRDIDRRDFQQTDISRHYIWQQEITPSPSIEMSFNMPLEELLNVTLYFFRVGPIRVPHVRMCFSRNLNVNPCNRINLTDRPDNFDNGVVEWPMTILTNATSVRNLRIDLQYDRNEDDFIFLSEVRIAERLQVQTNMFTPSTIPLMIPSMTTSTSSQVVVIRTPAIVDNITSITTVTPNPTPANDTIVSSSGDDDSVSVAVIIGAVAGTILLTIVIIIIIIMIVMMVCRRMKSRRADDKNVQLSSERLPQQHSHNNSDKHDPTSKLETVDALYMTTKVKSLDSLLKRIDDRSGIGVTITPNPSYSCVGPNSSQSGKELEYDYIQTDDGLVGHDQVVTSGGAYAEVTDVTMDTVKIDPNPAYSVGQDVKLEDNPSYNCI